MRMMEIGGVAVEVEEVRTAEIYCTVHDWCQCDGRTNARMGRTDATPPEQAAKIAELSLSLREPNRSSYAYGPRPSRRFSRYDACWAAYGRIVDADETPLGSSRMSLVCAGCPSYIRDHADGKHKLPMLSVIAESAQSLSKWEAGDAWSGLADHSAGQDTEKMFRILGTVPPA